MNYEIGNILKSYLENKSYVDKLGGVVKTLEVATETGKVERYPISCNFSQADCKPGRYTDFVMDSSKKSVIYFEEDGSRQTGERGPNQLWTSKFKLVGWLNLQKLGYNTCSISSAIVTDIIKSFPRNPSNEGLFLRFAVKVIDQLPKSANIFSRYTYKETDKQYLLFPFDYFALNIEVTFELSPVCIENFDIEPPLVCPTEPITV